MINLNNLKIKRSIIRTVNEFSGLDAYLAAMIIVSGTVTLSCAEAPEKAEEPAFRHHVIFDTDADNEIDDQHALAYLHFSGDLFAVEEVTVNATSSPVDGVTFSPVSDHYDEAKRVMQLCGVRNSIPLYTGVQGSFEKIRDHVHEPEFDGHKAVNFIIEEALKEREKELVLLPVGKLTNIALALLKEPAIAENVRVAWLGSNYPRPGEHNQDWCIGSMNYILDLDAMIVTNQLPDFNHDDTGPWDKAISFLNAYRDELPQLRKHDPDLPGYTGTG